MIKAPRRRFTQAELERRFETRRKGRQTGTPSIIGIIRKSVAELQRDVDHYHVFFQIMKKLQREGRNPYAMTAGEIQMLVPEAIDEVLNSKKIMFRNWVRKCLGFGLIVPEMAPRTSSFEMCSAPIETFPQSSEEDNLMETGEAEAEDWALAA